MSEINLDDDVLSLFYCLSRVFIICPHSYSI